MTVTADAVDLLAPTAPKVRRDRYGRYLVLHPEGTKPEGYTRMTTVAKTLDDMSSLVDWARRMGALGTAMRPDLVKLLNATDPDDRQALNKLAEQAAETAGSVGRRELGTMVHSMFERSLDAGYTVPPAHAADIAAIHAAIAAHGYEIVTGMSERIVVLDDQRIAGMPDCFLRHVDTGTLHVGDLKTGSVKYGTLGWAVQLAGYSMADAFYTQGPADDGSQDTREPMPVVARDTAVIIHCEPGSGSCDLYALDIAKGAEALQLALDVRTMRKAKVLTKITGTAPAVIPTPDAPASLGGDAPSAGAAGRAGSSTPERHAWALDRATAVVMFSAAAAHRLTLLWPEGVPTFRMARETATMHTHDELNAIIAALDTVEGEYEIPFGPPDPDAAPLPQLVRPEPVARTIIDEGPAITSEHANEIKAAIHASDAAAKTAVIEWVKQGQEAGRTFSLRGTGGRLTHRRSRIISAAVQLARWDCDDESARTAIALVIGEAVQPAVTVGAALGSLTTEEAERLIDVVVALEAGKTISFSTDGTPQLVA